MRNNIMAFIFFASLFITKQSLSQDVPIKATPDTLLAHYYCLKADSLFNSSKYDSSIYYLEEASLIYQKVAAKENDLLLWEKNITCLNKKVENLFKLGKFQNACDLAGDLLSFSLEKFSNEHQLIAVIYDLLGYSYMKLGNYEDALFYFNQAVQINRIHDNRKNIAANYASIGIALYRKSNYKEALNILNKAFSIYRDLFGDNYLRIGSIFNSIGNIYSIQSDYDKALEYYFKALKIFQNASGEHYEDILNCTANIGIIYYQKKEYENALEYQLSSLNRKLKIFGERHPELAASYNNLGLIYESLGEFDNAIECYQQCLSVGIPIWGEDHPRIAGVYGNIGMLFRKQGNFIEALNYQLKCLSKQISALGKNHFEIAETYENIVLIFLEQQQYDEALHYVQKGIISLLTNFTNPDIYTNPMIDDLVLETNLVSHLNLKAKILCKKFNQTSHNIKDLKMATDTYELSIELTDRLRKSFKAEGSKLFLSEQTTQIYEQAIQTALLLYKLTQNGTYLEKAFQFVEKSKSGILLASLQDLEARQFAGIPDSLLEQERKMRIVLAYFDAEIHKEKLKREDIDSLKLDEFENSYFNLNREYDKLLDKFEHEYPDYFDLKYQSQTISTTELQQTLDAKTVLLNYFVGDSSIYIFTISQNDIDISTVPIDSAFKNCAESMNRFIKQVDNRRVAQSSHWLYQQLIAPIYNRIHHKQKLIIIPDRVLFRIPFEALISKPVYKKMDFLINHHEIVYHCSANLYLSCLKKKKKYSESFLGFAPVFHDDSNNRTIPAINRTALNFEDQDSQVRSFTLNGKEIVELPFSEKEVEGIIDMYKRQEQNAVGYFHGDASEEIFKSNASKYQYIHIATHSIINDQKPNLSAIIFSQPTDSMTTEDGILYANEIYNLNLNADLVVLSSCESGIGKLVLGEGMMSFTRGFLYAGASNILVSLWKVPDKQTHQLMIEFYKNVLNGNSYSCALRDAKLKMLDRGVKLWSGFILIGVVK